MNDNDHIKIIVRNRKAYHDFSISHTVEAGIALKGRVSQMQVLAFALRTPNSREVGATSMPTQETRTAYSSVLLRQSREFLPS